MSGFERYIETILAGVECDDHDRADLMEEMKTHLEEAKNDYIKSGYTEAEAEKQVMLDFGSEKQIAADLQHSMFPFRKELLLFIGFGSILFSLACYFHNVVLFSDNTYIALILSVLIASMIIPAAMNPYYFANRKVLINLLLASLYPFYFFNFLVIDTSENWYVLILQILGILLGLCSLVMIILTALKTSTEKQLNKRLDRRRKMVHLINIFIGVVVVGFSIVFTFGVLVFAGLTVVLFIPIGLVATWGLIYWGQIKLIDHKR